MPGQSYHCKIWPSSLIDKYFGTYLFLVAAFLFWIRSLLAKMRSSGSGDEICGSSTVSLRIDSFSMSVGQCKMTQLVEWIQNYQTKVRRLSRTIYTYPQTKKSMFRLLSSLCKYFLQIKLIMLPWGWEAPFFLLWGHRDTWRHLQITTSI